MQLTSFFLTSIHRESTSDSLIFYFSWFHADMYKLKRPNLLQTAESISFVDGAMFKHCETGRPWFCTVKLVNKLTMSRHN